MAATTIVLVVIGCGLSAAGLAAGGLRGGRLLRFALAFGPGIGLGLASLQLFFWRLLRLGRPRWGTFLLLTIALAAAIKLWERWRRPVHERSQRTAKPLPRGVTISAWSVLLVTLVVAAFSIADLNRAWPDGTWDAKAIWNARARFLYRGYDQIDSLLKQVYIASHPDYPLLVPGAIAAQYMLRGGETPWIPRSTGLVFVVGIGLLTFAVVTESGVLPLAAAAVALVLGTPLVWIHGTALGADIAVAYYFLGSLAVVSSQLSGGEDRRLPPLLGGILLGLLAWTKNEGTVQAIILLGLFGLWTLLKPACTRRWRPLAAFTLGGLPGFLAVFLFKWLWAPESGLKTYLQGDWIARILSGERWWVPTKSVLLRLCALAAARDWYLAWPALIVGFLLAWCLLRRRVNDWFAFWTTSLLLAIASLPPIYAASPHDQASHIPYSMDRLLLQVYPAAAAGIFLAMGTFLASADLGARQSGPRTRAEGPKPRSW